MDKIAIKKSIKSLYILKEMLSFLSEKEKLNLIIYNKEFQKILGKDIEDYKAISGKYKIGGKMVKEENILQVNVNYWYLKENI